MYPSNKYFGPKINIFFHFEIFESVYFKYDNNISLTLHFGKFDRANFKYNNSFFKITAPKTQI